MKNRHPKRKMALKMMLKEEKRDGVSPFNGVQWNSKSKAIKERIKKKKK